MVDSDTKDPRLAALSRAVPDGTPQSVLAALDEVDPLRSNEPTLLNIVRVLSEIYTDQGVMTWLTTRNTQLTTTWTDRVSNVRTASPAECIEHGHIDSVWRVVQRLEGGL